VKESFAARRKNDGAITTGRITEKLAKGGIKPTADRSHPRSRFLSRTRNDDENETKKDMGPLKNPAKEISANRSRRAPRQNFAALTDRSLSFKADATRLH